MAISVSTQNKSLAMTEYTYNVTGLVNGANAVSLPTPPAAGSFPPAADWTPTTILCFPYASGGIGALVTPDLTTIANNAGAVTFTLYASANTNCLIFVY